MGIPRTYAREEGPIVTFNQIDIATGISRTNLYAGNASGAAVAAASGVFVLSNIPFHSQNVAIKIPRWEETNFDMEFDLPQTINGQAIAQFYVGGGTQSGGTMYARAGLKKVSAKGVITQLASGAAVGFTVGANVSGAVRSTVLLDIDETHFTKGDKLRFFVRPHYDWNECWLYCDPQGGTDTRDLVPAITPDFTTCIIQVPFKVKT